MGLVIAVTDFSASAQNALDYSCAFAREHNHNILLTTIYNIPPSYSGDGLSLASINDALVADKDRLRDELDRVKATCTDISIEAQLIVGGYLDSLTDLHTELHPEVIIIGAEGDYSDLWTWDDDWLHAVLSVPSPVLLVPEKVTFKPYSNIAFACDYKNEYLPTQIDTIKNITRSSASQLHIVHVTPPSELQVNNNAVSEVKRDLEAISPQYYEVKDRYVIKGLSDFVSRANIDLLIVVPHKHGLWENLMNKSYTEQLALLNNLPILALHDS
jgi:hypothetical protein